MAASTLNDGSRYRSLILSIVVFLALIGALLAFTFYTSSILERNTTLVNLSNKTANDAQAIIKDLFDLESSVGEHLNSPHQKRVRERLQSNTQAVDQLLIGMGEGLSYLNADNKTVNVPKLTTVSERAALDGAQQEWSKLKPLIESYLDGADDILVDSSNELALAYEQAKTSSLLMNDSLDELTDEVFTGTERQANTIRAIQILGVAAIFAYFLVFIFFFVRRLRETDAEADAARRETQEIMQTVSTGLFLLDKDLKIGQQHSQALTTIMGTQDLAGENLASVLRGRISEKDLSTTKQFIEQLYNPRVKEKLVESLNPLNKIMLHDLSGEESTDRRFLDFKFSRVYEDKEIARILVNVNDVSDAVYLEQRLERERSQNDMQIEMLTTILNVNPKIVKEFISNTKTYIEKMNDTLKNPGSSQQELERKLNAIYRDMHSLKGEASALKLHSFTKIATDAEDKLSALQAQPQLIGSDFLPLTVYLDDLYSLSNTIKKLGDRIDQAAPSSTQPTAAARPKSAIAPAVAVSHPEETLHKTAAPTTISEVAAVASAALSGHTLDDIDIEAGDFIELNDTPDNHQALYYRDFVQQIATRQGKKVELLSDSLGDVEIPEHLSKVVKEVSIQLLRNAVVHGIELPTIRIAAGKPAVGVINLHLQQDADKFLMVIQDDGQGINFDKIRDKLVSTGRFKSEAAAALNRSQLLKYLFASGFSTKFDVDEDGGRGVGLDVIRNQIKEHGGKLNVNSEFGKMTRFVITLPTA